MRGKRIDRLGARGKPPGSPIMRQRWEDLLFLHWPVAPAVLKPFIPAPLEIDTFEGQAWLGITPFHLSNLAPLLTGPLPGVSSFHELNVRTYVLCEGRPGIWFFSLDASKLLPAAAARIFFSLPYYKAQIRYTREHPEFAFSLRRTLPANASFRAHWRVGERLRDPATNSLAFFVAERYCFFVVERGEVYQVRAYHHPWILDEAFVEVERSTMFASLGLPEPVSEPLAHFSRGVEVEIWAPMRASLEQGPSPVKIPID